MSRGFEIILTAFAIALTAAYASHLGEELDYSNEQIANLSGEVSDLSSRLESIEALKVDDTRPPPASPCVIYLNPGSFDAASVDQIIESIECGPRVVMSGDRWTAKP